MFNIMHVWILVEECNLKKGNGHILMERGERQKRRTRKSSGGHQQLFILFILLCCFPLLWIGVTGLGSTPVLVIEAVVLSATNQIASAEHTVPT
jgi:Flp pilus assembly protein TadB